MLDHVQDGSAASSTATENEEIADPAAGGVQPDVDPETGVPFSEHPRWKAVYGELKEFKAAGVTPAQLKDSLNRLAYYDQLAAEARAESTKATPSDEERDFEEKRLEALKTLERLVPGISKLPGVLERLEITEKYSQEARLERAFDELGSIMKGAGLPAEEANVNSMADYLVPIIRADKKLALLFVSDPAAAVRKSWKKFIDETVTPLSRSDRAATQAKGAALSTLPRAGQGGGGGMPAGKGTAPPQTIDELFKQHKGLLTGKE